MVEQGHHVPERSEDANSAADAEQSRHDWRPEPRGVRLMSSVFRRGVSLSYGAAYQASNEAYDCVS